jgi:hypothetical protein
VLPCDPELCEPSPCDPLFCDPLVARLAWLPEPEPPDEVAELDRAAECPNAAKSTAQQATPADPTVTVSFRTRRRPSSRAATA